MDVYHIRRVQDVRPRRLACVTCEPHKLRLSHGSETMLPGETAPHGSGTEDPTPTRAVQALTVESIISCFLKDEPRATTRGCDVVRGAMRVGATQI